MKKLFALFVCMMVLTCSVNHAGDKPTRLGLYMSSLDTFLSSMAQAVIDGRRNCQTWN